MTLKIVFYCSIFCIASLYGCNHSEEVKDNFSFNFSKSLYSLLERVIKDYDIDKNCIINVYVKNLSNTETLIMFKPYFRKENEMQYNGFYTSVLQKNVFISSDASIYLEIEKPFQFTISDINVNNSCTHFLFAEFIDSSGVIFEITNTIYPIEANFCEYKCYLDFKKENIDAYKLIKVH
ncbi:MAG: hypothetical protein IPG55_13610 [Saprospiraceae bacterium]|nr:hypothetical protein [Candidatus Defluviibacterium haderslevense]MBK7245035.1 hypothetical protein [Candidatus Defluviibacterium haderslevense]